MILEILFDFPGLGPFVNLTLESILGTFDFDSFLQPFLASAEDRVLAVRGINQQIAAFEV